MTLVPVVGPRPIKHVHSRLILRTSYSRRHDRHVFQVTSSLQSWMPSLQSSVASVLELITDSTRCVVAMSFSRLCSLCKNSRRHIEGRVFSRSSFSEHLWSLFFSQSRDEVWVSSQSALNLHVPLFSFVRRETSSAMKRGSVLIHSHFVFGKRSCWQNLLVRCS